MPHTPVCAHMPSFLQPGGGETLAPRECSCADQAWVTPPQSTAKQEARGSSQ